MEDAKDSKRKYEIFEYGTDSIGRPGSWLIPTLEELVEACGPELIRIERCDSPGIGTWWIVNDKKGVSYTGGTPDVAVARLWLSLREEV